MKLGIRGFYTRVLLLLALLAVILPVGTIVFASPVEAVTTANITITVTPGVIGISCNVSESPGYDFGTVLVGTTAQTDEEYFGIDNTSTVLTNHSIGVTAATWTGGATAWTHDDSATPGADTIGVKANKGGTWGVGDIIVKTDASTDIATNQAITTDYSFGLELLMPTSSTVNNQKTNVVQVTVSAA